MKIETRQLCQNILIVLGLNAIYRFLYPWASVLMIWSFLILRSLNVVVYHLVFAALAGSVVYGSCLLLKTERKARWAYCLAAGNFFSVHHSFTMFRMRPSFYFIHAIATVAAAWFAVSFCQRRISTTQENEEKS